MQHALCNKALSQIFHIIFIFRPQDNDILAFMLISLAINVEVQHAI